MWAWAAMACSSGTTCGTGTHLEGGECVASDDTANGDSGTSSGWTSLFHEDWESGTTLWDIPFTNEDAYTCKVKSLDGSGRMVESVVTPTSDILSYYCWFNLIPKIDLRGYTDAEIHLLYDVTDRDPHDLAAINVIVAQDSDDSSWSAAWNGPSASTPETGTGVVDLGPYVGWSSSLDVTVRLDLQSCPDDTDSFCGYDAVLDTSEKARIWFDDLEVLAK